MIKRKNILASLFAAFGLLLTICSHAEAASRFWVGGDGTWDASSTTHWATTSGGAGGAAVPTNADTVNFDGNSGAGTGAGGGANVTVNANVLALQVQLGTTGGQFTGTLDFSVNNNSPSFSNFAFSGSGTRALKCGTGTFHILGSGSVWDFTTTTGLTVTCTGMTLSLENTGNGSVTLNANGLTFGNLTIAANTNSVGTLISSSGTFGTFSVSSPHNISLGLGITLTFSNFALSATATTPIYFVTSTSGNGTATIAVGSASTCVWCIFKAVVGATSSITATNSINLSTGVSTGTLSITAPTSGGGKIIGG